MIKLSKRIIVFITLLCLIPLIFCGCDEPAYLINGQTEHAIYYDELGRIIQRTEFNRMTKLTTVYNYVYTTKSKMNDALVFAAVEMCTIDESGNIIDEYAKDTFIRYDDKEGD